MASPSRASSVMSGPVISGMLPLTRSMRPWATGESAAASSLASRTRALPELYCSQQPRLPHGQRCPPGTTCIWPNSPATPYLPRLTCPSSRIAPPMPVPSVIMTRWSSPRPAPKRHSAQAAVLASLSTITGTTSREAMASRRGSSRQARCGANSTLERSASTQPAAPMPTACTSWRSERSRTSSTMVSSTTFGLFDLSGVSVRRVSRMLPSASTTPAITLVPPMSMPTVGTRGAVRCERRSLVPTVRRTVARAEPRCVKSRYVLIVPAQVGGPVGDQSGGGRRPPCTILPFPRPRNRSPGGGEGVRGGVYGVSSPTGRPPSRSGEGARSSSWLSSSSSLPPAICRVSSSSVTPSLVWLPDIAPRFSSTKRSPTR